MTFNSSGSARVLPPIMIPSVSQNITPVLPPVSRLTPQVPRTVLPADFSNPHDVNLIPSPMHLSHTYASSTPTVATKSVALNIYPAPSSSETTSTPPLSNGHIHFDTPQFKQQSYSQTRSIDATPQITMTTPPNTHNHHGISHQIYHQAKQFDPATELLAEKRRRNAGASARFRDRRKQREREMQEKCRFLERRVQELESTDSAKRIAELEKRLMEVTEEKNASQYKLRELEKEICQLRSKLCEQFEFLTPPPSSSGEYDSKDSPFDTSLRTSRESSTSSERPRKSIDVKSLLS
ncbi:6928_t:CDS:2, partial [Acaulospora morrowiae]